MAPPGVIRPIWFTAGEVCDSVNQRLPSGPSAMRAGRLFAVGVENSVIVQVPVTSTPILLTAISVNQILPSPPTTMPLGPLARVGVLQKVTEPSVVIRPIWLAFANVK